jgi:hypothetical protein
MTTTPPEGAITPALPLETGAITPSHYRNLQVDVPLRAEQVDFLQYLLATERNRLLRQDSCALDLAEPGSWSRNVDDLWSLFTWLHDRNLAPEP